MKREQVKEWLRKTKVRVGSVMMATAVLLGSSMWYDSTQTTVPELVTFVDMEETVTITEEAVPLTAPKVTKSTRTKRSTKKVKMKTAAKKSMTTRGKTYKKTTTKKAVSAKKETTTKTEVATTNSSKYKKNSKIRTDITTVKTTVTKTVVTKTTASRTSKAKTTAANSNATLASYTNKVDSRVLSAYSKLGFKTTVNSNVSYSGLFDARTRSITLKKVDATVLHELGHFVSFVAGNVDVTPEFKQVYNAEKSKYTAYNKSYILSSSSEYFAESFKNYTEDPAALKASRPQTYAAIQAALNKLTDSQVFKVWNTYKVVWEK